MAGISPGHVHSVDPLPYLGSAVPGGGGGSDAVPPLSSGVMRRMVTRRLIRLGPPVCSFKYLFPFPPEGRVFPGAWNCCRGNRGAGLARRTPDDQCLPPHF